MNDILTYADLNRALLALGFNRQEFEGKHYVYVHEPSDTLVTFPIVEMQTRVRPDHLITARKMVVERGIAEEETWYALLNNRIEQEEDRLSTKDGSNSKVSYKSLERALTQLGFIKNVTESGHIRFAHQSGAVFATRAYSPEDCARQVVVIAACMTVAEWYITDQDTFERMLAESAAQDGNAEHAPSTIAA